MTMSKSSKQIADLSLTEKKVVAKVYQGMIDKGFPTKEAEEVALHMAVEATGQSSSFALAPVQLQTAIVKDGFLSPQYYFDAVLSSTTKDDQGQVVSAALLKYLDENSVVDWDGDIKHFSMKGQGSWKGLAKMTKKFFDGKALNIRFSLDKTHAKFKEFMKLNKQTPFTDLSAEFYSPKTIGNKIVFSSGLGWTLTPKGSNPDAKIKGRMRK